MLGLPEEASEEDVLKAFEDRIGGGNGEGNTPDQKKKEGSGVETEDGAAGTNLEEEKVVANKIICSLLGLKAGAPTSEAAAAIMALNQGSTAQPQEGSGSWRRNWRNGMQMMQWKWPLNPERSHRHRRNGPQPMR